MDEPRVGPLDETSRGAPANRIDDGTAAGGSLDRGRASYARRASEDAHLSLAQADQAAPLAADDLELLATAA